MAEVKVPKGTTLGTLVEGEIFDDVELIIDEASNSMTTITNMEGIESEGYFDMRKVMYDVESDQEGNVTRINCNGYGEIYKDDINYLKFKQKLQDAGLWEEAA